MFSKLIKGMGWLSLLCMGVSGLAQEPAANQAIQELETKLIASKEEVVGLRKQVAELNDQLDRIMKQMSALEGLVQGAMTPEAKAKAEEELKTAVLGLLKSAESSQKESDLWGLYWKYPVTRWSDDLLWGLGTLYGTKLNDPKGARYAWQQFEESSAGATLEEETLALPSMADASKNRQAFVAKGQKPAAADRALALKEIAQAQIKLGDTEAAKVTLKEAQSQIPAGVETPLDAEIKTLAQQLERMKR